MYFTFESFMAFLDEPLDAPMGDRYYNYYEQYAYEAEISPSTGDKMNPIAERLRAIIKALTEFFTKSIPKFFSDLFSKHPDARDDPSTKVLLDAINAKKKEGTGVLGTLNKVLDWRIASNNRKKAYAEAKKTLYQHKREKFAHKTGTDISSNSSDSDSNGDQNVGNLVDNKVVDDNSFTETVKRDVHTVKTIVNAIWDIAGEIHSRYKDSKLESPILR